MENKDFTLKSGSRLHLSDGAWEKVVPLWSAVKLVTIGKSTSPEIAHLILASPEVQKAIAELYPWATYNAVQISPELFNDSKIGSKLRVDYLEICEKILEWQLRAFFLMTSSSSTENHQAPIESQRQP